MGQTESELEVANQFQGEPESFQQEDPRDALADEYKSASAEVHGADLCQSQLGQDQSSQAEGCQVIA